MSDPTPDPDAYFVRIEPSRPAGGSGADGDATRPGAGFALVLLGLLAVGLAIVAGLMWWVAPPEATTSTSDGPAAASAAGADAGFAFWATDDDGDPVRWNPCEPIRWVLNPDGAPDGARADVTAAAERITQATGIRFRFDGTTTEEPERGRSPYQADRYGEQWAPVLVAWRHTGQTDLPMEDGDRAVAVPVAVDEGPSSVFVSAQIVLNRGRDLAPGFATRASSWGATLLHELGHVVGLDHVDDPRQLMYPFPGQGPVGLAEGDEAGLRALGAAQGCAPTPRPGPVEVDYVDDFGH